MPSFSEDPLSFLKAVMDEVPLTGEQRRELLQKFEEYARGNSNAPMANIPASPLQVSNPQSPSPTKPQSLPPSYNEIMNSMPVASSPASVPASFIPNLPPSYNEIMGGAPQAQSVSPVQLNVSSPASLTPELVQSIVQRSLENQKVLQKRSIVKSVLLAMLLGILVSLTFGILFALSYEPSLLLFATMADIVIVMMLFAFLGCLHERAWKSAPHFGIFGTIARGMVAPVSLPLMFLSKLHERAWGTKTPSVLAKFGFGLIGILSVPVGLCWRLSGVLIRFLAHRKIGPKSLSSIKIS